MSPRCGGLHCRAITAPPGSGAESRSSRGSMASREGYQTMRDTHSRRADRLRIYPRFLRSGPAERHPAPLLPSCVCSHPRVLGAASPVRNTKTGRRSTARSGVMLRLIDSSRTASARVSGRKWKVHEVVRASLVTRQNPFPGSARRRC